MSLPTPSYFESRMNEIGLTADKRLVRLQFPEAPAAQEVPIVSEDKDGNICFLVYDLDGYVITYHPPSKAKIEIGYRNVPLEIKRLKVPRVDEKGKSHKYNIPKGVGAKPLITPGIMDKFRNEEVIDCLILTEGYMKALCGWVNGFDIIGLTSISTYRDKATQTLHPDIIRIIRTCKVKAVVILYDGDCLNISTSDLEKGNDLSNRPFDFFSSARNIRELLKDHLKPKQAGQTSTEDDIDTEVYFAHVKSESIEGSPKGFDDAIVAFKNSHTRIAADNEELKNKLSAEAVEILKTDLFSFSRPGNYFFKLNISYNINKLQQYFHISSAQDFYLFHSDRIDQKDPETGRTIAHKEFIFNGTKYKYSAEKEEVQVMIPSAANLYLRVGDQYHKKLKIPNKYGQLEGTFHRRQKSTIIDDHGKKFTEFIPKYQAFCNVPDHVNYQEVIHGCFNTYHPFEHSEEEGDCENIKAFLVHIFGEQIELGLDYIQLLFQQPTQVLPILCLVSKENNTGKTTFSKLLKAIFTQNMVVVSNSDLQNDFNAIYATRLIICCDEAFIEKKVVIERIKSLSTSDKITMNAKGKDQVEIDFFGKFILLTNNEENFVYASDDDMRYWVRKVPVIPADKLQHNLFKDMLDEIPAFLYFLNKRQMSTECKTRMWFTKEQIKTEALNRVIQNSMPSIQKEIISRIRGMFFDFGEDEILMTTQAIRKDFFNNRFDDTYVEKVLKEIMKIDRYHVWAWVDGEESFDYPSLDELRVAKKLNGLIPPNVVKTYKVHRHSYPRWEEVIDNNARDFKRVDINWNGRPWVFKRGDFIAAHEETTKVVMPVKTDLAMAAKDNNSDELPF